MRLTLRVAAGLIVLSGCATVPDYSITAGPAGIAPAMEGARGPLSAARSKALLDRLGGPPGGFLWRHLAIEQAIADGPLVLGNRTTILRDGPAAFRAIFAAIAAARLRVDLEYFIIEDVTSDGVTLGDLLARKRAAGVAVNLIYDSYGSSATPTAFFERLRGLGVAMTAFNPVNPLLAGSDYAPNRRDHRKILIADGKLAIIGGVNLSVDYQSNPLAAGRARPEGAGPQWRDTDLQIEGPAVAELAALFAAHWSQQSKDMLTGPPPGAPIASQGREVVRIIGSTPDHDIPRYYVTLLSAIGNAGLSISITAAYFVPTRQEAEDLADAARRGVKVRLLLPDSSDSQRAIDVAHSHYADLMEAGVEIYETHGLVLHAKTVVIDGVWSIIGSSNFDQRSVLFNDEVDAVVLGPETAGALELIFADDLAAATRIDPLAWGRRPLGLWLRERFSRGWESLL